MCVADASWPFCLQPKPLQYERTVYITYLDEDLMIARDETGSPDILVRKKSSVASSSADLAEDSQV